MLRDLLHVFNRNYFLLSVAWREQGFLQRLELVIGQASAQMPFICTRRLITPSFSIIYPFSYDSLARFFFRYTKADRITFQCENDTHNVNAIHAQLPDESDI